ncbi:MAG: undecaprenyl-diphosphate phosphatase [Candidatus Yonathbacteria bacterium]|nr:undecaprenyl-diphosphate phosphatase [Candidatus Yonathbacteria bacterium]
MLDMLTLGAIQGIAEWLPLSSEGLIVLAKTHWFGGGRPDEMIRLALFLHMGTALASIIYFRKEIGALIRDLFSFKTAGDVERRTLVFYGIAIILSGGLGYALYKLIDKSGDALVTHTAMITLAIGIALCVTGILQILRKKKEVGMRTAGNATVGDGVLLGLLQALAVVPGISRSGITVSGLIFRGYSEEDALRMSFMLSIPIVIMGNIILNMKMFAWDPAMFLGLLVAFVVGYATIGVFFRLVKRVPFGPFVLAFGLLVIASVFI